MNELCKSCLGIRISIGEALAGGVIALCRLEYGHSEVHPLCLAADDARDSRGEVGLIVLELAGAECLLEGHLLIHKLIDSIGLVAVGNDGLIAEHANGIVDDKVGIGHPRLVECLGTHSLALCYEDAVAAVLASTHNEVCGDSLLCVGGLTDYDTSAVVGEGVKLFLNGGNLHFHSPM